MASKFPQGKLANVALVPQPNLINIGKGYINLAKISRKPLYSKISTSRLSSAVDRFWKPLKQLADDVLPISLIISCDARCDRYPELGMTESYVLEVSSESIRIESETEWGILLGLVTLGQLVNSEGDLPCCSIEDAPRYPWRGLLLDVARHFFSIESLKRTIDGMAWSKLNVLHLHLTDDQAFRFASKLLSEEGSQYSNSQLKDLVEYAADRGVRIVPEIDVPGHVNSLVSARPELGAGSTKPTDRFGSHEACLDPTKDEVYLFLDDLFKELITVFPDRYVHLGGDELDPSWWTSNKEIGSWMASKNLVGVEQLQGYFTNRVSDLVAGLDRIVIGWDEVLTPSISKDIVIQSWRGAHATELAIRAGHQCVVSSNYYLDLFYPADIHYLFDVEGSEDDSREIEKRILEDPRFAHIKEALEWSRDFSAIPKAKKQDGFGQVIGGEACMWTELVNESLLDIRLWTRLPAMAEKFWSPADINDPGSFYQNFQPWLKSLSKFANIDPVDSSDKWMSSINIDPSWLDLIHILEPIKWYSRLLGEDGLRQRISGNDGPIDRAYDVHTPLNKIVDGLLPESIETLQIRKLCRRVSQGDHDAMMELLEKSAIWFKLSCRHDAPEELRPVLPVLRQTAETLTKFLTEEISDRIALRNFKKLNTNTGEYLLAVVPLFCSWLREDF